MLYGELLKLSLWGHVNVIKILSAPQFNSISEMVPVDIPKDYFTKIECVSSSGIKEREKNLRSRKL